MYLKRMIQIVFCVVSSEIALNSLSGDRQEADWYASNLKTVMVTGVTQTHFDSMERSCLIWYKFSVNVRKFFLVDCQAPLTWKIILLTVRFSYTFVMHLQVTFPFARVPTQVSALKTCATI